MIIQVEDVLSLYEVIPDARVILLTENDLIIETKEPLISANVHDMKVFLKCNSQTNFVTNLSKNGSIFGDIPEKSQDMRY